jgi:hypothetical protein
MRRLLLAFLAIALPLYSASDDSQQPRHRRTNSFSMKRPTLLGIEKDKTVATLAAALQRQLNVQEEALNPSLASAPLSFSSPETASEEESQPLSLPRSAPSSRSKVNSFSLSRKPSSLPALLEDPRPDGEQPSQ